MKLLVCIKQVPDMESRFKANSQGVWFDETDLAWRLNEYDEYAVEQAVQLREQLGETAELTVLSIGPDRVGEVIWFDPEHDPEPYHLMLVASDFERLIVGATTAYEMLLQAGYFGWDSRQPHYSARADDLAERVIRAVLEVDPRAREAEDFWYSYV